MNRFNAVTANTNEVSIEVFFDLICPWCFIGKRELDLALRNFAIARPDTTIRLLWRSFPLLPDTPTGGLDYESFYERRLGGPAAVAARRAQVLNAAQASGLQLHFERIRRMPNTFLAHTLVQQAVTQQPGAANVQLFQSELIERLFKAYFIEGLDIGDTQVLAGIASSCGAGSCPPPVGETERQVQLLKWQGAAVQRGISSVPTVIIAGAEPLVGAVPSETLLQVLIAASRPATQLARSEAKQLAH